MPFDPLKVEKLNIIINIDNINSMTHRCLTDVISGSLYCILTRFCLFFFWLRKSHYHRILDVMQV